MKYLLDTCLVSEMVKKDPDPNVVTWLDSHKEQDLFLSVLTIGELTKGIAKLPDNPRKEQLQSWVDQDLVMRFQERIIGIDIEVATKWGEVVGESEALGQSLPVVDSLLAATALVGDLTVVTRNASDIERCKAKVLNPWGRR